MNQDILQGKWEQTKGHLRKEWSDLTDKDLEKVKGKKDQLLGLLQEKYGYTIDVAENKLKDFMEKVGHEFNVDTQKLAEMGAECKEKIEGKMKKNVFQTALIAFGVGFLSEKLFRGFFSSSN